MAAESAGSLNPSSGAVLGSPALAGSATATPALSDTVQAMRRVKAATRGSGGPNPPPRQPQCPCRPQAPRDNSNAGMWLKYTCRVLSTLPAQTLVLLRWCQNIRHQPWLCCCQRCRCLGGGGQGRGGGARVWFRQLVCLSLGLLRKARGEPSPTPHT